MSEVLVRVHDKVSADLYQHCMLSKRGDVIAVQEDGYGWGNAELTMPYWRIVKLPNISVAEARTLLAPELDADPAKPSRTLQRYAFKLDIANVSIPQAVRNFIADDTRASPSITFSVGVAAFRALKVAKPPITDPNATP